ncbi:hypothetical protein R84B8_01598 [Treponema sp. R8-4-B8]
MRRILFVICFLLVSFFSYAQQALPGTIIGKIPDKESAKTFQIQVGAFKLDTNVNNTFFRLQINALNPVIEKTNEFTKVMIRGIPANQVLNYLAIVKQAGFNEVIIREDAPNIPTIEVSLSDEFFNSEIESLINSLSDEEFLTLLSLIGEYPEKDILDLITSINNTAYTVKK